MNKFAKILAKEALSRLVTSFAGTLGASIAERLAGSPEPEKPGPKEKTDVS